MHTHRTRDERVALAALLREGFNQSEAAEHLGVHRSTVCRELQRNAREDGSYHATHADCLARERRRQAKEDARLLENNERLATLAEALLDPLVSSKVIGYCLGRHHQTPYAWLYRSRPDLLGRLPQRGRKRRRYGSKRAKKQGWTKHVRSIEERPALGWEGDTIKGSSRARSHPWQRGKNENTNGRLRRPFPKRSDFRTVSKRELADVVDLMNHPPRESLGWRTPCATYEKACCNSD